MQPFPLLPSAAYKPKATERLNFRLHNLDLTQKNVEASSLILSAWALLAAKLSDWDQVCFHKITEDEASGTSSVDNTNDLPVQMEVDWSSTVDLFVSSLQGTTRPRQSFQTKESDNKSSRATALVVIRSTALDDEGRLVKSRVVRIDGGPKDYVIVLNFVFDGRDAQLVIEYDLNVLDEEQVKRISNQLQHILHQLVDSALRHERISDLSLVSDQDLKDIWRWNATIAESVCTPVHETIATIAREQPSAVAISAWDGELTYKNLDDLSSSLASHLRRCRVVAESIVPICFEKSMWTPVALVAIMKAGGATIALDTTQPEERLRSIIQQVSPVLILSSPAKSELATRLATCNVVVVDSGLKEMMKAPVSDVLPKISLSSTAFLLFTSGSTGTPKGVQWDFRGAATTARLISRSLGVSKTSRVWHFASYAFTIGVIEMLITLSSGGTLCTPSDASKLNDLSATMAKMKVNWAFIVPSVAKTISPTTVPSLNTAILTGESLTEGDVRRWVDHVEGYNYYGCTECPYIGFCRTDDGRWRNGKVGLASGTAHWIADVHDESKLVPVGAVGQLLVESPVIAKGYHNRYDTFRSSLCINPAWLSQGSQGENGRKGTLFKTGDLVKYHSDGSIIYVGRKDAQVKVRGQRVELREVEYHIRQIVGADKIDVAVDVIHPDGSADPILVAFVAVTADARGNLQQSRDSMSSWIDGLDKKLGEVVPQYMIPGAYVPVEEVPLLKSGKLDRRRIREIGDSLTLESLAAVDPSRRPFEEVSSGMEERLQALWAKLLHIHPDPISANDSFMRIGGNSITAMRLVEIARLEGLELSVYDIFRYPRLRDMALQIRRARKHSPEENPDLFSLIPPEIDARHLTATAAAQCSIEKTDVQDIYPCTPLQEGMIAVTERRTGSYTIQHVFKLRQDIESERLAMAVFQTVQMTPILRTRIFDYQGEKLYQALVQQQGLCRILEADLDQYLKSDLADPMGLGKQLSRSVILSARDGTKYFVWTMHHSIHDGWAIGLLLNRLEKVYNNEEIDQALGFQSYIKALKGTVDRDSESFWRNQFKDSNATDFVRLPQPSYHPCSNASLQYTVRNIQLRESDFTMPVFLRAAWALLISRYSGSDDVLFGATVMGRQGVMAGVEHIIGPTIATVPIRQRVRCDTTVEEFLQAIHTQAQDTLAFEHDGLPKIRHILNEHDIDCDFQTLLVVQPEELSELTAKKLFDDIGISSGWNATNTYAMAMECQLESDGIQFNLSYDSNLVPVVQAERLVKQLERVLRQLCDHTVSHSTSLGSIAAASADDLSTIWGWHRTVLERVEKPVHDLISQKARVYPDGMAVRAWDGCLTYQELDELSTNLAIDLLSKGLVSGCIAVICYEKSFLMPITMLAVMKTGAACLATDPSQPEVRMQSIIAEAKPHIFFCSKTTECIAKNLSPDRQIMVLEKRALLNQRRRVAGKLPVVDPEGKVAIIYTSGSTGKPKGATLSHVNLSTAMTRHTEFYRLSPSCRVYDFHSYSFDAVWFNFLIALYAGGCLCIPSEDERKNDIAGSLQEYQSTFALLPPSLLRAVEPDGPLSLETLVVAGEAPKSSQFPPWTKHLRIINAYGPAECTFFAAASEIYPHRDNFLEIGPGITTNTWIVDVQTKDQLAPIGAIGELYLEGPLVGLGYLNNPGSTAEAFVEDPVWLLEGIPTLPDRNRRVYRTGDLVKYTSGRNMAFVGRGDHQVKIRGQRIELGEVEHHVQNLLQASNSETEVIAEVAVSGQGRGVPSLVVFLSPPNSEKKAIEEIKSEVAELSVDLENRLPNHVPAYMVPTAYIPLQKIPRTTTGKIDRKRLREEASNLTLPLSVSGLPNGVGQPSSSRESIILEAVGAVLGRSVAEISVDTTFIRLGGDSISAMQVVSKCRSRNIVTTVAEVLKLQTIRKIAASCRELSVSSKAVEEEILGAPFKLSPIQRMHFQNNPQGMDHFTQAFLLRLNSAVSSGSVLRAVGAVVNRHSMLRARFHQNVEGDWEQSISEVASQDFHFEEVDVEDNAAALKASQTYQQRFSISNGPVFSCIFFRVRGEQMPLILLSAHHLVVDLVSWRVIFSDLELAIHRSGPLKPAPTTFQAWSKAQDSQSQQLSTKDVLPFDIEPPVTSYWIESPIENTEADADHYLEVIDSDTTSMLLGSSNASFDTEPVDLMLSALMYSFSRSFPRDVPPTVLLEGHGREPLDCIDLDISETVGWFTTMFPVQIKETPNLDLLEIVRRVKDYRRAVPSKGRPYFAHRYQTDEGYQAFKSHSDTELLFNYMGLFQQLEYKESLFQRVTSLNTLAPTMRRMALVEINAGIELGELNIQISVNRHVRHQTGLKSWIKSFGRTLRKVASQLVDAPQKYTLSDFPLLSISYGGLDTLANRKLEKINQTGSMVDHQNIVDIYPCTAIQEGIILSSRKGIASYNNAWIWDCVVGKERAPVCPAKLGAAWETVVKRHSILSNIFVEHPDSGRFIQVQLKHPEIRIEHENCDGRNPAEALKDRSPPSFPAGMPPHLFIICTGTSGNVACRLDMNHVLFDATSISVLINDLTSLYNDRELLEPPSFRDVVRHSQRLPKGDSVIYWNNFLAGAKTCDLPGPSGSTSPRDAQDAYGYLPIATGFNDELDEYCRNNNTTRAIFTEVAWALALSIYTGMSEVCFGYVSSGRDADIQNANQVVGPMIDLLVAKINVAETVKDVFSNTYKDSAEHFNHKHISLAQIQHERGSSSHRLFNSAMTVREIQGEEVEQAEGMRLKQYFLQDSNEYEVLLVVGTKGKETELGIHYKTSFADGKYIEELADVYGKAVSFLLAQTLEHTGNKSRSARTNASETVQNAFFRHMFDTAREEAAKFWQAEFSDTDFEIVPHRLDPTYRPRVNRKVELVFRDLALPFHDYKKQVFVRTAMAILQRSYTGQSAAYFGEISNTSHSAIPIVIPVNIDVAVHELLDQIQSQDSELAKFNGIPLTWLRQIVERVNGTCNFQTLIKIEYSDDSAGWVDQWTKRVENSQNTNATEFDVGAYPLVIAFQMQEETINIGVNYDDNVIQEYQVDALAYQFEHILRQFSVRGSRKIAISQVEVVSSKDINTISQWNASVSPRIERCLHDIIFENRSSNAIAVDAWDGKLTYGQLDQHSSILARKLGSLGVGKDTIIPLLFEKSMWTPVAMLAVMRSGAASIALDISLPEQRLRQITDQAPGDFILTSKAGKDIAAKLARAFVVVLDQQCLSLSPHVASRPLPTVHSSSLLCINFTSGSTGIPKGAMMTHENFASAIYAQRTTRNVREDDRFYDFASYAFDVAWSHLLCVLSAGARLCIPSETERKNDLIGSMSRFKITYAELTPSVARVLVPEQIPTLRTLILSGEPVIQRDFDMWTPFVRLVDIYGPAECSMAATAYTWSPESRPGDIGRGVGINPWLVDAETKNLAPIGSKAELWLEGPPVGNGYLNDVERTATSFVANPPWMTSGLSSLLSGSRGPFYRTGDIVKYKEDGSLLFVGRKDDQFKIRGQRVELEDIEHHIRRLWPREVGIRFVVDVVSPQDSNYPVIVLFYCQEMSRDSNPQEQRTFTEIANNVCIALELALPSYMLPSSWVRVEKIPLTATGKTDRRSLRTRVASMTLDQLLMENQLRTKEQSMHRAPVTAAERQLQDLWSLVLVKDPESISTSDNFFRIGGDSITAMRLVGAARQRNLALTVADVFTNPRLADLAMLMRELDTSPIESIKPFALLKQPIDVENVKESAAKLCRVSSLDVEDVFPCTPLQEGLIALTTKRSDNYIANLLHELQTTVDIAGFKNAWNEVIESTPILRTRIIDHPDQGVVQVVLKQTIQWEYYKSLDTYEETGKSHEMGLGTALVRLAIVEDSNRRASFFALSVHHSIYDGYSLDSLMDRVISVYDGGIDQPAVPFQNFVSYVRSIPEDAAEEFWTQQFDSLEADQFPELPSPTYEPMGNESVEANIEGLDLTIGGFTSSTIIRAAWSLLISRYTGAPEAVFGAIVTGRQAALPSAERIAGPTIATVPVRVKINPQDQVETLLETIQSQATEMISYEQTGLRQISSIGDEAKAACNFETLLAIQPSPNSQNKKVTLFAADDEDQTKFVSLAAFTTYALTILCEPSRSGLGVRMYFDNNVISREVVHSFVDRLECVLRQICEIAESPISNQQVRTASEQDIDNLWALNKTVPAAVEKSIPQVLSEAWEVQNQPEAPAICAWDGQVTYSQLDVLSTHLAKHLIGLGLQPNTRVALCFQKSVNTPVCCLGVLKAGGTLILLDVTQPASRLRSILEQVGSPLVLCSTADSELANQLSGGQNVVSVDNATIPGLETSAETSLPYLPPQSLAWIIFTSGSTGRPKGVMVSHGNACSGLVHQESARLMSTESRVLDFSSYGFDGTYFNMFHTWHSGGCVCVPSDHQRMNDIGGAIRELKVNCAFLTPTVLNAVEESEVRPLDTIYLGGEKVPRSLIERWNDKTRICVVYGPTETTIMATYWPAITPVPSNGMLGLPSGLRVWVVDPITKTLSMVGAVGEMWLEGPMVSQGYVPYFNDSEKTAQAFIEDPTWLLDGSSLVKGRRGRLYATGDLVRQNIDGTINFVGRKDGQVKIGGQRLELDEVEHHVRKALYDACSVSGNWGVIAEVLPPQGRNSRLLVAFLRPPEARYTNANDMAEAVRKLSERVHEHLYGILPSYMVPSLYIPVEKFPATSSGKTDRQTLRRYGEFESTEIITGQLENYKSPVTPAEETIRDIWSKVLNLPPENLSVEAGFIGLGGDSITAMQIVSRCRSSGIAMTVKDIMKYQTIRRISAQISEVTSGNVLTPSEQPEILEWDLSPIQKLFFSWHPQGLDEFNQTCLVRLRSPVAATKLSEGTKAVVARHQMLRSRFSIGSDHKWEQSIVDVDESHFGFSFHEVESIRDIQEIVAWRQSQLDIRIGAVFAVDAFVDRHHEMAILFTAHHLVVDLVSWRIIWHDMEHMITDGSDLPKPTPFLSWVKAQSENSQKSSTRDFENFDIEIPDNDFWGICAEQNTYHAIETLQCELDKTTTELLMTRCNETLATEPINIMVASLKYAFDEIFPERKSVPIFLEGHGREQINTSPLDVSETVGWFTAIYPLFVPNYQDILDTIASVKDRRKSIADNGRSYFDYRYHSNDSETQFPTHDNREVLFNYLGVFQQLESPNSLFEHMPMSLQGISPQAKRAALIEVSASVRDGKLHVTVFTHRAMKHQERLKDWTERFLATLQKATSLLLDAKQRFTPSDFPLANLTIPSLKAFFEGLWQNLSIEAGDVVDMYACTPIQNGILLSTKKGSASYMNTCIWKCVPRKKGTSVSTLLLRDAWIKTIQRHSILSTIFVEHPENGLSLQVLLKNPQSNIQMLSSRTKMPKDVLRDYGETSLSPARPMHTFTICQSSSGDVACRLDVSHALLDASSSSILLSDIMNAYHGVALAPAPGFRYMVEHIHTISEDEILSYWTNYLDGVSPCEMPGAASPGPVDPKELYGRISVPIESTEHINDFCKRQGRTRAVFLQLAWSLVLSSYTMKPEACFGYVASGRDLDIENIEEMVGPAISMMVARTDLRQSISQALSSLSDSNVEHFGFRHVPLAEVQHRLGLGGQKLFNTAISVIQESTHNEDHTSDIKFIQTYFKDAHEFDLLIAAILDGPQTKITLVYRNEFSTEAFAEDICTTFESAIRCLLDIDELPQTSARDIFFQKLIGSDCESATKFWTQQLSGTTISDFPRFPAASYSPIVNQSLSFTLGKVALGGSLERRATVILTAWSMLLSRYTSTKDFVIGLENFERGRTRTMPLRVTIGPDSSIEQLRQHVELQLERTKAFAGFGIYRIRQLGRVFGQALAFRTKIRIGSRLGGAEEKHSSDRLPTANDEKLKDPSALSISCHTQQHGIKVQLNFDSKIMSKLEVSTLYGQFKNILLQIASHEPSLMVSEIDMIPKQDFITLWEKNKDIPRVVPASLKDRPLYSLVDSVARLQPQVIAVQGPDGDLTYGEIESKSTHVASSLIDLGVKPDTVVALCFDKSKWVPVIMLAISKAGSIALLQSSSVPKLRREDIYGTIGCKICLVSSYDKAVDPSVAKSLTIDDLLQRPSGEGSVARSSKDLDSKPCMLLYTSGSTGKPKGVMWSNNMLVSNAIAFSEAAGVTRGTRTFQFTSYDFDVSVIETYSTLIQGGTVCIPSETERLEDLGASIQKHESNLLCLTPTVARPLEAPHLSALDTLVFAGEQLHREDIVKLPKIEVVNWYGPAESPFATHCKVDRETWRDGEIGQPSAAVCWLVDPDDSNKLAPSGAVAELLVEGPIVSQGYYQNAPQTSAAFVVDPAWLLRGSPSGVPGRRGTLYRTGDLVRQSPDGALIYIGRKDAQRKVRGQRVELDDVEYNIRKVFPGSKNIQIAAEIVTSPDENKLPVLVAFVAFRNQSYESSCIKIERSRKSVDKQLRERIPKYMIPSAYLAVESIPVTNTGKVDRMKLRELGSGLLKDSLIKRSLSRNVVDPSTSEESRLRNVWAKVLGSEALKISRDDSFFGIGGDSIVAMKLVAEARRAGLLISMTDVLRTPRLCDMALATKDAEPISSTYISRRNMNRRPEHSLTEALVRPMLFEPNLEISEILPVTDFQRRSLVGNLAAPRRWWANMHMFYKSNHPTSLIKQRCESIWEAYELLRTIFVRAADNFWQIMPRNSTPKIEIIQIEGSIKTFMDKISKDHESTPYMLGYAATDFTIVQNQEGSVALRVGLSHAQYDGISLPSIIRDLEEVDSPQDPPKAIPFASFINHAEGQKQESQRYWTESLKGSQPTCVPPSSRDSDEAPESITVERTTLVPQVMGSVSPATVFTAACAIVLSKVAGQSDVTLGRLVSGRSNLPTDLEDVFGPCINYIPTRVRFSDGLSKLQVLDAVHNQYVDSLPFETLGYGNIITNCTDWHDNYFGCTVQYQNISNPTGAIEGPKASTEFYRHDKVTIEGDWLEILAMPSEKDLKITLLSRVHDNKTLESLAHDICREMEGLNDVA